MFSHFMFIAYELDSSWLCFNDFLNIVHAYEGCQNCGIIENIALNRVEWKIRVHKLDYSWM